MEKKVPPSDGTVTSELHTIKPHTTQMSRTHHHRHIKSDTRMVVSHLSGPTGYIFFVYILKLTQNMAFERLHINFDTIHIVV
jgi:hypothetical protein